MKKPDWEKEFQGINDFMNKDKPKKEYTCTLCGSKGFWSDDWEWYGSYLLSECIPEDIVYTCSGKCRSELNEKLHTGEIHVTDIVARGPNDFRIVKERRGY